VDGVGGVGRESAQLARVVCPGGEMAGEQIEVGKPILAEGDHLAQHQQFERRIGKGGDGVAGGVDVDDGGGAAGDEGVDAASGGGDQARISEVGARLDHSPEPVVEGSVEGFRRPFDGQIEVAVAVDEAGTEKRVAEVDLGFRRLLDGGDKSLFDDNHPWPGHSLAMPYGPAGDAQRRWLVLLGVDLHLRLLGLSRGRVTSDILAAQDSRRRGTVRRERSRR